MQYYKQTLVTLGIITSLLTTINGQTVEAVDGYLPQIELSNSQHIQEVISTIKGKSTQAKEMKQQLKKLDEQIKQGESDYLGLFNYEIQNSQRVSTIRSQYAGVSNTLTDEEIDLASRVGVTYFGDSLVAGSQHQFQQLFHNSNVQGIGSMQIAPEGMSRLSELVNKQSVAKVVVIVLGTNRGLEPSELDDMVQLLGERYIFFVDTISEVGHKQEVADEIQAVAKRYPHVYAIPFSSQTHDSYFDSDRIHHSNQGKNAMVQYIAHHIYQTFFSEP